MPSIDVNHSTTQDCDTETRIDKLIEQLTLEDKIDLVNGVNTFETRPIPRIGLPVLRMADGPMGCNRGQATTFPAGVAMAASWDTQLVQQTAAAIGREVKAKGLNMLLGPCVHIHRVPMGGRNFESFCEDPFLNTVLTIAYINGVQSENIIACVKHFACNNQEHDRLNVSAVVDKRTLEEIYFPAFRAAIHKADALSVMGAYNRFNGTHCCQNESLLTDILKTEWQFNGLVVSDWHAVHDSVAAFNAGCDLEMPGGEYFNKDRVVNAIQDGRLIESTLDESIRRIFRVMMRIGLFDKPQPEKCTDGKPDGLDSPEHRKIALDLARSSMVLLKNDRNLLPLDATQIKSIAMIGPNAAVCQTGGGGSSHAKPFYTISPMEGIENITGGKIDINHEAGVIMEHKGTLIETTYFKPPAGFDQTQGLLAEYFDNMNLNGNPVLQRIEPTIHFNVKGGTSPVPQVKPDFYSIRWSGKLVPDKTGDYWISITSDDGSKLFFEGKQIISNWAVQSMRTQGALVKLTAGKEYDIRVDYFQNTGSAGARIEWGMVDNSNVLGPAIELAKQSDVAVLCVGLTHKQEAEGWDRSDLSLPYGQDDLINAITAANPNTIVVIYSGGSIDMTRWLDQVPAVIQAWFPGQEGGRALAEILFGNVNPSGKLPATFVKRWEDSPACGNYPGENFEVKYAEGIFVGYRHFDTRNIEPLFPFGYGLSYTTFEYTDLAVDVNKHNENDFVHVTFSIQNTGQIAGAETAQVYVKDIESSAERPEKELKGFRKIFLEPGEQKQLTITLDKDAFAFYHPTQNQWIIEPGEFEILVGSSSRNIRLSDTFQM